MIQPISAVVRCITVLLLLVFRDCSMTQTPWESSPGSCRTSTTTSTPWTRTWSSTSRSNEKENPTLYKETCLTLSSPFVYCFVIFRSQVSYFEIYLDKIRDLLDGKWLGCEQGNTNNQRLFYIWCIWWIIRAYVFLPSSSIQDQPVGAWGQKQSSLCQGRWCKVA